MSHNLFGERFYGYRQGGWHLLGHVSQVPKTAQEAMSTIGGYWVEKRPIYVDLNGARQETGSFAIVRSPVPDDPQELVFGYVEKGYNILQPLDICMSFDRNVQVCVETMGMLGKGEKIFLTWELPKFAVGGKDEIAPYGAVVCGYDGKFGASLFNTYVRIVCQNTFNLAVERAESKQGGGKVWTGRHNSANIERDLGIWLEHVQVQALAKQEQTKETFDQMYDYAFEDEDEVDGLLDIIYPDPAPIPVDWPIKLRSEKEQKYAEALAKSERDRELTKAIFDGEGTAIDATAWGLFNSVTEYESWGRMTKKPAEYSILLGNRGEQINKAYFVIQNYMKQNEG